MELGLSGKIVLVTGAAGGIGAAVARAFCGEQVTTIFSDIDGAGLAEAVRGFEPFGVTEKCDVTKRDSVRALFHDIGRRYGVLHVLVNCAALNTGDYIEDIKEDDLEKVLNVNLRGYMYTTMAAVPLMKKAGYGRLININSTSGLKASAGLSLYSSSKYFARGFAISAALELGKHNITSNSICPSDIYPEDTGGPPAKSWMTESLLRVSLEKEGVGSLQELIEKRQRANPMRRSCTRDDVAHLALFLASERAGFINGQSIGLNGGLLPY
jgi:NAD(P)-dependent dehydrogenase (short-subunit alcohol dehydrogenase family)